MRLVSFLLCLAADAWAQQLWNVSVPATPGGRFYYLAWELDTNGQPEAAKLYSWSTREGKATIFIPPARSGAALYSFYPDGQRVGVETIEDYPATGRRFFTVDLRTGQASPASYRPLFSPNGRFESTPTGLIDRETGRVLPRTVQVQPGNDGSGLWRDVRALYRVEPDGTQRVINVPMRNARLGPMDALADRVVVCDLLCFVISTVTGKRTDPPPGAIATDLALSPDGNWFLSRVDDQSLALCPTSGESCRVATSFADLAVPFQLSNDLNTAWVKLYTATFVRLDLRTGERSVELDCDGMRRQPNTLASPGSLLRLSMGHQPEKILLADGRTLPVFRFASDGLSFAPAVQIPWEVTEPVLELVPSDTRCPFPVPPLEVRLAGFAPAPLPLGPQPRTAGYPDAAYHSDWTLVTQQAGAAPGELLHLFAAGLGPVACALATGDPAPLDRLCPLANPMRWHWSRGDSGVAIPADVAFAGLAPGLVGVYQIDVRAPEFSGNNGFGFVSLSVSPTDPGFVGVYLRR